MGTVVLWTVLKAIELAEITQGESGDRKDDETRDKTLGHTNMLRVGCASKGVRKTLREVGGHTGYCDTIKAKKRKSSSRRRE